MLDIPISGCGVLDCVLRQGQNEVGSFSLHLIANHPSVSCNGLLDEMESQTEALGFHSFSCPEGFQSLEKKGTMFFRNGFPTVIDIHEEKICATT